MLAYGKSANVLKYEHGRFEFDHQAEEMFDELISRVVESALADHGKALAGRAPHNYVDRR